MRFYNVYCMNKLCFTLVIMLLTFFSSKAQTPTTKNDSSQVANDSIRKQYFFKNLGQGYFPTKYIDVDLRYLIKYNQYEGFRNGLGGITNHNFSKKLRLNSYVVYGFRDHTFKYSLGARVRLAPKSNTWLNISYTDDLSETGSTVFLTDKRFFQFFEPRLLNIDLFHKHITKAVSIEHQLTTKLNTETQFALSNVDPTYNYEFVINNKTYRAFHLSTSKIALQWSPFDRFETKDDALKQTHEGYPKFTLQYTKNYSHILKSELNFSKIDFRTIFKKQFKKESYSILTLTAGIANGETPLTHLYHAYPNNITKETIMQRFSVAGITSFETMFFNEFFSDRFTTLQFKYYLSPFKIGERYKPQLVLISRFALGDMSNIERHQNVSFGTLEKGFTESGFEINKLLFGFGLSFTYRYGAYHLPQTQDNIALKFTFNVTL